MRDLTEQKCTDGAWRGSYKLSELLDDLASVWSVPPQWLRVTLPHATFRALVFVEVSRLYEAAWQLFVAEEGGIAGKCQACIWVPDGRHAVLAQCSHGQIGQTLYCGTHRSKRKHGEWGPALTLAQVRAGVRGQVAAEARRRALRRAEEDSGSRSVAGFNTPASREKQSGAAQKAKVRVPYVQKAFAPIVEGEPREYEDNCVALPPFVCQLCQDQCFATKEALLGHIASRHGGQAAARQAYLYREGRRPRVVKPQVWRHCSSTACPDTKIG